MKNQLDNIHRKWTVLWILQKILFYVREERIPYRYYKYFLKYLQLQGKLWSINLIIKSKLRNFISSKVGKKKDGTVIVVCAADKEFIIPMAAMLKSLTANFKIYTKLKIYILNKDIKEEDKEKILRSLKPNELSISWIEVNMSRIHGLKISEHISSTSYYRLLIPSYLPKEIDKAIYLDSDLVINDDIGRLWEVEIGNYYILAVQEQWEMVKFVSSKMGLSNYKELGLDSHNKYFNAGVMVINLNKWRAEHIDQKIIEYIRNNERFIRWHDQDGINAVLSDKCGSLDLRWNLGAHIFHNLSWRDAPVKNKREYEILIKYPYIIHFSTDSKPWHKYCSHPYRDMFFYYLGMTEWRGWRPK